MISARLLEQEWIINRLNLSHNNRPVYFQYNELSLSKPQLFGDDRRKVEVS